MPDEKCIVDPQRDCLGLQKANMLEKHGQFKAKTIFAGLLLTIGYKKTPAQGAFLSLKSY